MAVVGDSFIEAAIVPPKATVHARLQSHVGATARVYSFAAAGAGLPQYLIWARHARDTYKPDLVLINIIPNDFDESLHFIEHSPGFWRFEKKPDGSAAWRLTEYDPSLTRRMFRQSALAMYLTLNARLHTLINSKQPVALSFNAKDQRWVGNIAAMAPEERLREYRWAVDRFLGFLPEYSGVATDRIILCFDGYRPQMYANDAGELAFARASTWGKMRAYMMQKAAEAGITTIDLEAVFTAHYAKNRQRFEPPSDNHWNGVGHGALADAVMDTAVFKRVLEPAKSTTSR